MSYLYGSLATLVAFLVGFLMRPLFTSRREPPPLAREDIKSIVERAIILHELERKTDEIVDEIERVLENAKVS